MEEQERVGAMNRKILTQLDMEGEGRDRTQTAREEVSGTEEECMGGLSFLLNSSVVQYSNWPVADGYITSLNVPANPSATPKTGTPYSGHGMSFGERIINTLFHWIIIITRYIQIYVLDSMFTRKGFPQVGIIQSEAERLIYAGRSEFLFDVIRPINNRVKHFGGGSKINPRDYVTVLPEDSLLKASSVICKAPTTNFRYMNSSLEVSRRNNSTVPLSFINCVCSSKSAAVSIRSKQKISDV
ncbi:hypothetical protein COOONC_19184 [Cooperia oncophora]